MSNYRDIGTLRNWDKNPRSSTDENIERLIKQIKKLGVYKPLLITDDGTVLGGNMRLKALQKMGEKKVWVSVVDAPTDEKKIEYALSDNDRVGKYEEDQLEKLIGDFLGSGSTLIACEQTNRTCYGMELDPKYVDVIRKRYDNFIKLKTIR